MKITTKILTSVLAFLTLIPFAATNVKAAPGDLDLTFGSGGKLTDWSGSVRGVAIQPDGKIVIVGGSNSVNEITDFMVARYNPDGTPDTTFGGGTGRVTTDFDGNGDISSSVVIQPDGKIVAAGASQISIFYGGIALARYNPDGSLDTTFGGGSGKVLTFAPCWRSSRGMNADVAIQPNGKLVGAVGTADYDEDCETDGFLFRYHSDGSPDTSFGIVSTEFPLSSVILQPADGKIVAGEWRRRIARFNSDGSPDTGYGSSGIVTIPDGFGLTGNLAFASDGKIVAAGYSYKGFSFALFRFNANGSPDSSFDGDGIVTTPSLGIAMSVVIQSDGKIVAAGSRNNGSNRDFALARYNLDGSLDNTFGGGDGITTIDFNGGDDFATKVALDSRGRAVVAGLAGGMFALARFMLAPPSTPFDFDGDGKADISVFRLSDRTWYLNQSTNGFSAAQFGLSSDKITPADFDGDGKTDIAVFRDGFWYLQRSASGFTAIHFGQAGDVPVPADYDGDGLAELAVYRGGTWFTLNLQNNQFNAVHFGAATDKPVGGNYDGDNRADYAVYRDGIWYLLKSTQGFAAIHFGLPTDRLVPADYDGDGKTDVAVYRDGVWYLLGSQIGFTAFQFGNASDIPAPADYDGDGRTDAAVFRGGVWYLRQSANGLFAAPFGLANDKPVPSVYLP